ncbi:protein cholesin isoform 2-T2 [Megaptera novaeangliae]
MPVSWALPAPPSLCRSGEWSGPRRCRLPQAGLSSPLATRLRGLCSRRPSPCEVHRRRAHGVSGLGGGTHQGIYHFACGITWGAASPEEQRVLERKLKKERKKEARRRLQEAGVPVAQSPAARRSGAALALDYLCSWAQQHKNWRFQKTRQTWLLLHMYDCDQVPDEHFSTLLAYLEGLRGRARELTVQKAEVLMRELDEAGAGADAPLPGRTQRVRQVCEPRNQGAVGKQESERLRHVGSSVVSSMLTARE